MSPRRPLSLPLVWKTFRDARGLVLLLTFGLVLFEIAAARVLVEVTSDLPYLRMWLQRPMVQFLIKVALGAEMVGPISSTTLATFALGHPLLWALSWTLLLTIGTGVVAGEIGRGTADLLLTLPLSRGCVYRSASLVCVAVALFISVVPLFGLWLGNRFFPLDEPLEFHRFWPLTANLAALNLAILGLTLGVSSLVARRGTAIGIVLAGLLFSDLMNFLSQFWAAVRPFAFLGFLHYYKPLPIVRSGAFPARDVAILLAVAVVSWTAGLWHFRRRDIPAV